MSETWSESVTRSVETLDRGDMEGFLDVWSDDVVWHIGGRNRLTGVYRGKEAVRDAVVRAFELSGGGYQLEPVEVLGDDKHLVIMFHATGEREGNALDTTVATFITVGNDGKWTSSWWLPGDQRQYDAYWS